MSLAVRVGRSLYKFSDISYMQSNYRNRPAAEKANFESLIGLVFNLLSVKVFDKNRKI